MLKHGEANPLAVFGLRHLDHCPPHFERVEFDLKVNAKVISDWIYTNLEGRFWYGDHYYRDADNNIQIHSCAAFEIASEASMFALMLDTINSFQHDLL